LGAMPFGPVWDDAMHANSMCWDYTTKSLNPLWLNQYKVAGDYSAYAEAWATMSLAEIL